MPIKNLTTLMKFINALIATAMLLSMASAEPILDVKTIVGLSPQNVKKILGPPQTILKTKYGPKMTYKDDSIEIVFIKDKADFITITPKTSVGYDKAALKMFGIDAGEPTFSNENVIRWEPCGKYLSVSIFPRAKGKMDYLYLRAFSRLD